MNLEGILSIGDIGEKQRDDVWNKKPNKILRIKEIVKYD